jgi:DNA-binding winged helix-turn-helix (wHTH) protein
VREAFAFDDANVDLLNMLKREGRRLVPLTPQEFKILNSMAQNAGRVISWDDLLNEI